MSSAREEPVTAVQSGVVRGTIQRRRRPRLRPSSRDHFRWRRRGWRHFDQEFQQRSGHGENTKTLGEDCGHRGQLQLLNLWVCALSIMINMPTLWASRRFFL